MTASTSGPALRPPRDPSEWRAIRDLCCRTADEGRGISRDRWPFHAEYWVGPYQALLPQWTLAAFAERRVVGYLTGCPATARFALPRLIRHRWPLFQRVSAREFAGSPDAEGFARRFCWRESDPSRRLALRVLGAILTVYPAHLHVNVDQEFSGQGVGKSLVNEFCARLILEGVTGVHLFCGEGPVGFYRKLGFTELARTPLASGASLHALGKIFA